MKDGKEIKYNRLRTVEQRAQQYNHTALCLPVYRDIVNKTVDLVLPEIKSVLAKYSNTRGRPGYNAIATPFIKDVGARRAAALAVITVVNNFHRPASYQSLAVNIGNDIAIEWSLLQEDPALIKQINKYRFGSIGNKRRRDYLCETLAKINGNSLTKIEPTIRAAIGNLLLGIICRTKLVELSDVGTKGLTNVLASQDVINHLQESHHVEANSNPILLPRFTASPICTESLIRPQKGQYRNLSTISSDDSDIVQAATILNHVGWEANKAQLDFIRECSSARSSVLGLPYAFSEEFPRYTDDMDEGRIKDIKRARAKLYSERNKNRSRRARLLSSLSFLPDYCGKECFFTTEADFRGRLYTTSDLVSYQGPDWLRSIWQFKDGVPIQNEEHLNWLYIHAANCYGYNRSPYSDRIKFIVDRLDVIYSTAENPWEYIMFLKHAKDPFRFLAACREIKLVKDNGWGTPSTMPVQLDATSQGIQIWATLLGDRELMEASNVIGETPRDIYQEFADTINDCVSDYPDIEYCQYFKKNRIDRKLAKGVLMVVSYGGSIYAIRDLVDSRSWSPSFRERQWLAKTFWEQAEDVLHIITKAQQRLTQCVSEHHAETEESVYCWSAPSGVKISQKYLRDKRIRIKDSCGNTIHTYRINTDKPDFTKSSRAFPPNFIHSLDASILTKAIVQASTKNNITSFMAIHDCIGIHAANVSQMSAVLRESFTKVIESKEAKLFENIYVGGGSSPDTMGFPHRGNLEPLSPYLFS